MVPARRARKVGIQPLVTARAPKRFVSIWERMDVMLGGGGGGGGVSILDGLAGGETLGVVRGRT